MGNMYISVFRAIERRIRDIISEYQQDETMLQAFHYALIYMEYIRSIYTQGVRQKLIIQTSPICPRLSVWQW